MGVRDWYRIRMGYNVFQIVYFSSKYNCAFLEYNDNFNILTARKGNLSQLSTIYYVMRLANVTIINSLAISVYFGKFLVWLGKFFSSGMEVFSFFFGTFLLLNFVFCSLFQNISQSRARKKTFEHCSRSKKDRIWLKIHKVGLNFSLKSLRNTFFNFHQQKW